MNPSNLRSHRAALALSAACCGLFASAGANAQVDVLVSGRFNDQVLRYSAVDGSFIEVFADGEELDNPIGMAIGPDGNLYVATGDIGNVLRYDIRTGDFIDEFIETGSGGLLRARGMTLGPDGDFYVSSGGSDQVLQYNGGNGDFVRVFAESEDLDGPIAVEFGPDGDLYVASALTNRVLRFDGDTGEYVGIFAFGNGLLNPTGLAFDREGNLLVGNAVRHTVMMFNPVGQFVRVFAEHQSLNVPIGVTFGPDGQLYVASFGRDSVIRFDGTTGEFIDEFVPSGSGGLNGTHFMLFVTIPDGGCTRDPQWQCDGDVDGDGQVNPVDSGLVQAAFGSGDEQDLCNYDVDCDGQINPVDSGIVQSLFGTCEEPREACP